MPLSIFSSKIFQIQNLLFPGVFVRFVSTAGVLFVTLVEEGETMQVVIERSLVGERLLSLASRKPGYGRHHHRAGHLRASRNGTESLIASTWHMAPKSLHPIPFDSFTGPEARLRRPFHGPVGIQIRFRICAPAHCGD